MQDRQQRCTVNWGENNTVTVISPEELVRVLDELERQYCGEFAILVEVTLPNGDALGIGLGHSRSVLSYMPGTGLPPYKISKGPDWEGEGLVFYYHGRWTHFDEGSLVSPADARKGICYFLEHGKLLDELEWTDV